MLRWRGGSSAKGWLIRFRYAADAVAVRMYRSLSAMMEGWTKNLALLFPLPMLLGLMRLLDLCSDLWAFRCSTGCCRA